MGWIKKEAQILGRYSIAGVINTLLGYTSIFILMALGVGAYLSNALTYSVGFVLSFALNKKFVFRTKGGALREGVKFFILMFAAFLLNLAVLHLLLKQGVNPYLSQCLAGGVYSILVYAVSRSAIFVKKGERRSEQ